MTRIEQVAPRGDQFAPLLANIGKALGMFFVDGDPYIRFNLPGRPLFPVLLGVLFILGVLVALIGVFRGRTVQRRGAYFSLIVLTIIMLLPTALAVNEITPSNLRAIGLMPGVFAFPALGAWWLIKKSRTLTLALPARASVHADYADKNLKSAFIRVHPRPIILLVLMATTLDAGVTYFGQYVTEPQLVYSKRR